MKTALTDNRRESRDSGSRFPLSDVQRLGRQLPGPLQLRVHDIQKRWLAAVIAVAACTALLGCGTVSRSVSLESDQPAGIDYDTWVRFTEQAFWFNHDLLDRYALKPAATVWHEAVPDLVSQSLGHAFDNLDGPMPKHNEPEGLSLTWSDSFLRSALQVHVHFFR